MKAPHQHDETSAGAMVPAPQPEEAAASSLATGTTPDGLVVEPGPESVKPGARASAQPSRQQLNIEWLFHRVEVGVVLCGLLVASLFVPQVRSFARRNQAARAAEDGPPYWQALEALELNLYDARFAARGIVLPKCYDKLAIIGVDQESLSAKGQWPWPRSWHAQLIRKLKRAGAKVIALDFDFSDKQNPLPDGALSPADKDLAAAMHEAGNVILAGPLSPGNSSSTSGAAQTFIFSSPLDALDGETPTPAVSYVPPDSDEAIRRYPFKAIVSASDVPSLGLLAAGVYQALASPADTATFDKLMEGKSWPAVQGGKRRIPLAVTQLGPTDAAPRIWTTPLHFWGPPGTFRTYPYVRVLDGTSTEFSEAGLRDKFGGRIVFVGATAIILKDMFRAPRFNQFVTSSGMAGTEMAGVEMHATAAAMFLDGTYIQTVSTATTLWTLFGLTIGASLWLVALRGPLGKIARELQVRYARMRIGGRKLPGRIQFLLWFILYLGLGSLPLIVFWQVAQWLFAHRNLWVVVTYPLMSATCCSGVSLLLLFSSELVSTNKIRRQMGRFISKSILEEVLAHPEEDYPRPKRVNATVLFTDLEGFTTYSENHTPEEVIRALNDYMGRMTPIIERYNGTLDKYIGDAIMSYFGAPIPYFDHCSRALFCAVEMQEACAKFREETGVPFFMRIGVHTGDVIAGAMGSEGGEGREAEFNYTVIGDTVNVASRLEGKNKDFDSWIMCSAETYEAAPEAVEVEPAVAQVRGKAHAVEVYIVRGLHGQPHSDQNWGRQFDSGARGRLRQGKAATEEPRALEAPLLALPQAPQDQATTDMIE